MRQQPYGAKVERKAHEKSRAERVGFVCLHNHPFSGLLILPEKASTDGLGCATFIAFLQLLSSLKIISSIFNPPLPYKVQPQNTKKKVPEIKMKLKFNMTLFSCTTHNLFPC